jgi:hypothetical protein
VQPFAAQTVRENIAVGAHLHEPRRVAALAAAEAVAQRVGLAAQLDKPAADLTVAGRKRLELARALATQPKLLLLDEVLAGLNPQEIGDMIPVVRGIAQSGVTVLMIEHVMQAVMNLAEHVWVLAQGQLIAQGSPAEVTSDAAVIEAYLGHGTAAKLAGGGRTVSAPLLEVQQLARRLWPRGGAARRRACRCARARSWPCWAATAPASPRSTTPSAAWCRPAGRPRCAWPAQDHHARALSRGGAAPASSRCPKAGASSPT